MEEEEEGGAPEPEEVGLVGDEPPPELLGPAVGEPQDEVRHVVHLPAHNTWSNAEIHY